MTTTAKGILCWGLAVLLAAPAWGQEIGDRLRIEVEGTKSSVIGNLAAIDESKLVIEMSDGGQVAVSRTKIKRLSRRVGTQTNGKKGALSGLVTGMVLGVPLVRETDGLDCIGEGLAYAFTGETEFSDCSRPPTPVAVGAMVGALFPGIPLAGVGWLIGKKIKTDKWELIKLGEEAQVGIAPVFRLAAREGGVRATIGLSMQFSRR